MSASLNPDRMRSKRHILFSQLGWNFITIFRSVLLGGDEITYRFTNHFPPITWAFLGKRENMFQ
jgi:hypothetical protein